jgi:hypothetical protein
MERSGCGLIEGTEENHDKTQVFRWIVPNRKE